MKKVKTFILLLVSAVIYGQNVDSTATYCMIVGQSKMLSNNLNISIDDGSSNGSLFNPKFNFLKDDNGKKISFETMVSALNFMAARGWEFVDAYAIYNGNQTIYNWLLKKKEKKVD